MAERETEAGGVPRFKGSKHFGSFHVGCCNSKIEIRRVW
jgi:hypothetical protein